MLFRKFIRRCYHLPSACLQGIALGRKVGTEVPIFYPAQSEPGSNRYRFDPNWLVKFTNSRTNPRKSLHSCRAECLASAFFTEQELRRRRRRHLTRKKVRRPRGLAFSPGYKLYATKRRGSRLVRRDSDRESWNFSPSCAVFSSCGAIHYPRN